MVKWKKSADTLSILEPRAEESKGLQVVLTCVHNVTAPLSMLFCMIMETVQLGYGESLGATVCASLMFTRPYSKSTDKLEKNEDNKKRIWKKQKWETKEILFFYCAKKMAKPKSKKMQNLKKHKSKIKGEKREK